MKSHATVSQMGENIAYYAVSYVAKCGSLGNDDLIDGQMKKNLDRMLDELTAQNNSFTVFLSQLQLTEENCCQSMCNIFTEMLADGVINWGRIITIYCFSGCAAKYLLDQHCSKEVANLVAKTCADFVSRELAAWVEENGGWDKFRNLFGDVEKSESESETVTRIHWHDLLRKGIDAVTSAVSVR